MGKITALFFSDVPTTIRAMENCFRHDNKIYISTICISKLADFLCKITPGFEVVILDDGALNADELNKVQHYFLKRNLTKKHILLTSLQDIKYLDFFIFNGIEGIVSQRSEPGILREGSLNVAAGKKFIDLALQELYDNDKSEFPPLNNAKLLTSKEIELLKNIGNGYCNKEIAQNLCVSVKTVESYKWKIIQKLKLKNTNDLLRYSIKQFNSFLFTINISAFILKYFDLIL